MKILLTAGFNWGLAPDLPQIDSLHYAGIRRDVTVENVHEFAGEIAAYPQFYLLAIVHTKLAVPVDQLVSDSADIARALVDLGLAGRCGLEISNEPNLTDQFGIKGRPDTSERAYSLGRQAARFREAVNRCHDAIQRVSSDLDVVAGGVSNTGQEQQDWLRVLLDGLHPRIVAAYHTYRTEASADSPLEGFASRGAEQAALRAILGSRRRMNTETGWHTMSWVVPARWYPLPIRRRKAGQFTKDQVAGFFRRECQLAQEMGCELVALYQQNDAEPDHGNGFGHRELGTNEPKPIARIAAEFQEEPQENPRVPLVSFRVLDEAGAPIADVITTFTLDDGSAHVVLRSDATGTVTYRARVPGVGVNIRLEKAGYDTIERDRRLIPTVSTAGPAPEWAPTITLARWYPLVSLTVVDRTPQPGQPVSVVPGVAVTFRLDDDSVPVRLVTNEQGRVTYRALKPGTGVWVDYAKAGYTAGTDRRLIPTFSTDGPEPEWPPTFLLKRVGSTWKPNTAQLSLAQGDFMIWCPEIKPHFDANGWDPVLQIRRVGDNGAVARGIEAGWVWSPTIGNYPPDQRQIIYRCAKEQWQHTHFALHVSQIAPGAGYHGIFPITREMAANYGAMMNTVCGELREHRLIADCYGVAPDAPPAPGFDRLQVTKAATDWDNTAQAASRIRAISDAFPNALLVFELPAGNICPDPSPDDPVPPNEGSSNPWIRGMRQKFDRFVGVLHEADIGQSVDEVVQLYTAKHAWWHDLPENQGEVDTYDKFWNNMSHEEARQRNDAIAARCPWLVGSMSGWTMRPAPADDPPVIVQPPVGDMIDPTTITMVDRADLMTWPATARITRLDILEVGVHVEFTKRFGASSWPDVRPPGWDGDIQFCLGLVCQVNGRWYGAAPIQSWRTLDHTGGYLANVDVDGTGLGQVARNWFPMESGRWKALGGKQPATGETFGFFVAAGDIRGGNLTVHERSNIVTLPMPAKGDTVALTWS